MADIMKGNNDLSAAIKEYLLREFLPGEDADELTDSTPLITGGILDSISTIKLVAYLEDAFGVSFQAHEMHADYLNTISQISATVESKRS